jgi:ATP-binding cassette subfamily B multidrug efflux pump
LTKDNTIKKIFDLRLLRRVFSFSKPYSTTLYTAMALSIILALLAPLRPYLIQTSVDKYISKNLLHGLIMISVVQLGLLVYLPHQLAGANSGKRHP